MSKPTIKENLMTVETEARPPRRPRRILTVLGVLALGVAVLAVAVLATSDETTEETSFASDDVDTIRTAAEAGNIEIVAADRADIAVMTVRRSSLGSEPRSAVQVEDGVLSMEGQCRSFLFGVCSVSYQVSVPTGQEFSLELQTTAGNIDLTDVSGKLLGRSTAGNINVTGHAGEEADVETTAGNVSFEASEPPTTLSIQTTLGNITIRVPDVGYRIDTQTTVGNVNVDLNEDPNAEGIIVASTTTGSIELGTG
jgi:hypothetical protein